MTHVFPPGLLVQKTLCPSSKLMGHIYFGCNRTNCEKLALTQYRLLIFIQHIPTENRLASGTTLLNTGICH